MVQILSRELRSELGISPFILSSGAFSHPDVKATISEGNIWDFHGGEMETSMVMAVDESLVKLDTSEAGQPEAFMNNQTLLPYGQVSIGWVSEDWKTKDGKANRDRRGPFGEPPRKKVKSSCAPVHGYWYPDFLRFANGKDKI